jgi:5'-nucleotidase (lipoprotein e(P4) family)
MRSHVRVLVLLVAISGCAARTQPHTPAGPPSPSSLSAAHENLNAVLWVQTALEYEAATRQAYWLAQQQLDRALADPTWTAAPEQTGDAASLPPAVIVDIDETVLDNSYYQARMIRDNTAYSEDTWGPWVKEARATAIPGAREFAEYATEKGVTIFYVTNRMADLEEATRKNLAAEGFPLASDIDTVLTRGAHTSRVRIASCC